MAVVKVVHHHFLRHYIHFLLFVIVLAVGCGGCPGAGGAGIGVNALYCINVAIYVLIYNFYFIIRVISNWFKRYDVLNMLVFVFVF